MIDEVFRTQSERHVTCDAALQEDHPSDASSNLDDVIEEPPVALPIRGFKQKEHERGSIKRKKSCIEIRRRKTSKERNGRKRSMVQNSTSLCTMSQPAAASGWHVKAVLELHIPARLRFII